VTDRRDDESAILVLPTTTADQLGPVAAWISTGGWASAVERQLGRAWIVTRHGVLSAQDVLSRAAARERAVPERPPLRRAAPTVVKTLVKDVREFRRARRFRVDADGPWAHDPRRVAFVWQRHELFHTAGLDLADELRVPSVMFVPALVVWQAEQWSVFRPGWGKWLERHGEAGPLRRASVVACGTDVIADQVRRLGVDERRVLVTPTGVDLDAFAVTHHRDDVRRELGITAPFVVGWAGSFRPFHALDHLVRAASMAEGCALLLIGDGPERARIEVLARDLGVDATFTGLVPHDRLVRLLAAVDVGVVLAKADRPFHYSPLKVAEYLAAGVPVVAPDVPQLTERLEAGVNAAHFTAGEDADLARVLSELAADPTRVEALADGARRSAGAWSWDHQVLRIRDALSALDEPAGGPA
jgi:glycosyltransferase involved in cell wall biosynthesis